MPGMAWTNTPESSMVVLGLPKFKELSLALVAQLCALDERTQALCGIS